MKDLVWLAVGIFGIGMLIFSFGYLMEGLRKESSRREAARKVMYAHDVVMGDDTLQIVNIQEGLFASAEVYLSNGDVVGVDYLYTLELLVRDSALCVSAYEEMTGERFDWSKQDTLNISL